MMLLSIDDVIHQIYLIYTLMLIYNYMKWYFVYQH